ncbi:MAG: hypothetical protein Q9164_003054 [Protoblastenia rupestris]
MSSVEAFGAPALEIQDPLTLNFISPAKKINEGHDVTIFLHSKAYSDIMKFLLQLNRAIFPSQIQISPEHGKNQVWEIETPNLAFSEPIRHLQKLLQALHDIVAEAAPDAGPRRFGNVAFRKWYSIVEERTLDLLQQHLPKNIPSEAIVEISSYFLSSFGSAQRLDYGSGHELSFLAFLGCIYKLGGFPPFETPGNQERSIVLGLINPYLSLIRHLIKTYTLEPAGSHGVWGLDDHSFLPYIFGSAQYGPPLNPLSQTPTPTSGSHPSAPDPSSVTNAPTVQRERKTNMYFGAIGFIHDVKSGPFWEHSPMLYDISGVRGGWAKINKGMLKMYNAEVLSKFPVVQHFRFGALFSWERDPDAPPSQPAAGSVHVASQPVKEGVGASSMGGEKSTLRGTSALAGEGTQAPWASSSGSGAVGVPPPPVMVGTAAPWKRAPVGTGAESGMRPTRFSQPKTKLRDPMDVDTREGAGDAQRMPPPGGTPWGKPS